MREWLRNLLINATSVVAKPKSGVYIMNGHFLSRQSNNDVEVFASLLAKISQYARFVTVQEAVDLVKSGQAKDVDETLLAFTFDDGFDDCYFALAPALEKYATNACFFVNPGFIEGDGIYQNNFIKNIVLTPNKQPMPWSQLKELVNRGFIVGNHTFDHVRLASVDIDEAEKQVLDAKLFIEDKLAIDCQYFAWPFGQYADVTEEVVRMLRKHHSAIFSGCDYQQYLSFGGEVMNRRHFEADWSNRELKYFLSKPRSYAQ